MPRKSLKNERLGEERYNNNGCLMRIVEYNRSDNIIVEFQDEYKERVKTQYIHFVNGGVENPQNKKVFNKDKRIGEIRYSNSNEPMKIIEYKSSSDVLVEFQDDNRHTVWTSYDHFVRGEVKNRGRNVGETNVNYQGETMEIIEYNNNVNVVVKFYETGKTKRCRYDCFQDGQVKDDYYKDIFGVACIGGSSSKYKNGEYKKSYKTWFNMLNRCYNEKQRHKNKTYEDCFVCDEWLCYENFEKWYEENYYEIPNERMQLDKDIIKKDNRVYCPELCVFVPGRINILVMRNKSVRGKYPIGVRKVKGYDRFVAVTNNCGEHTATYHSTPEEAFYAYKYRKEKIIKQVADEYKDKIPQRLYDALYRYEVEITD